MQIGFNKQFQVAEGKWTLDDGWASKAGVGAHSLILEYNNKSLAGLEKKQIMDLVSQPPKILSGEK